MHVHVYYAFVELEGTDDRPPVLLLLSESV
jgi:hypothetical protein